VTKHAPAVHELGSDLSLMVDRAVDSAAMDVIIESHSFARVVECHTGCLLSYHNEEYTWGITIHHLRSAIPQWFRPYISTPRCIAAVPNHTCPLFWHSSTSTGTQHFAPCTFRLDVRLAACPTSIYN